MLNNAYLANATSLPVALAAPHLMFPLPVASHIQRIFEDAVRQELTADLLSVVHLSDEERHQIEDIAWLAFACRLALHTAAGRGEAAGMRLAPHDAAHGRGTAKRLSTVLTRPLAFRLRSFHIRY